MAVSFCTEAQKNMEQFLKVGVITSVHGIRGEVKVFPTTDDPRRFKKCREVLVDPDQEKKILEIEHVKFFKQFAIIKFKGFENPDEIMPYKGRELYVTRENAVPLGEDEYYIADLIGIQVSDENDTILGILEDVIETGANDVYSVRTDEGREILLPAIRECILEVDVENRRMKVHVMDGLMD